MPLIFTKSEIRNQLCDIGFEPDEDELKTFIRDLKRLIKAEEKQRRERKVKSSPPRSSHDEGYEYTTPFESESDKSLTEEVTTFSTSTAETSSASARSTDTSKNQDVEVHPTPTIKYQGKSSTDGATGALEKKRTVLGERTNNTKNVSKPQSKVRDPQGKGTADRVASRDLPLNTSSTSTSSSVFSSYTSSFEIDVEDLFDGAAGGGYTRPSVKLPPKSVRNDPVSLYHFYKAIWDKQKIPGEDPRMNLRWNVRAGTLGRVPCDANGVPTKYLR